MAQACGAPADEVVRLESVAEQVAATGCAAGAFAGRFAEALGERTRTARGLKSVAAYRCGLDFDPAPRHGRRSPRPPGGGWTAGAGGCRTPCWCATSSGRGWSWACLCSSTPASGIRTWTCGGPTRCCCAG
ncbi:hypothetical protein ACFQ0B_58865 [Nonomuraea thailandensis]